MSWVFTGGDGQAQHPQEGTVGAKAGAGTPEDSFGRESGLMGRWKISQGTRWALGLEARWWLWG